MLTRRHYIKIEDKVVKINQAIQDVLRGLYFTYCLSSRLNLPDGFEYEPRGIGHFGLIFDQNLPFFKK